MIPGPRRRARPHRQLAVRRHRSIYVFIPQCTCRPPMKRVAILGSTGSIGQSALAVVGGASRPAAGRRAGGGRERAAVRRAGRARTRPTRLRWRRPQALAEVQADLRRRGAPLPATAACGAEGLIAVATHPDADIVLFASSGTAALDAVLAAIDAGKTIALANKEILVMAGSIVMERARRRGVAVLPVDSEHNAIHQCLHGRDPRRDPPPHPDGVGRSVPRASRPHSLHARDAGRRAAPSDVEDGAEDHDRLGDADEQGPRGHRGALAVRRRAAPDRRRRAPPVDRPFDGRARRRVDHRAARRDRHAPAHSVRVLVSGALGGSARRRST